MVFGCQENSTFGLTPTYHGVNPNESKRYVSATLDNCKRETFEFEHLGAALKFHFLYQIESWEMQGSILKIVLSDFTKSYIIFNVLRT